MQTVSTWGKLARLGPFRWRAIAPLRAARAATGVIVPLMAGWAAGHSDYGAYVALGALPAGSASFQGETRSRVTAVVVASLGMAGSTFIGAVTAAVAPWLLIPVVAVWGYFIGLSISLGPWASVAVLQWSVALLIAVGSPSEPSEAALRSALVLAGGLLQAVLVAISWAVRPGSGERRRLAASFRALAAYTATLAAGQSGPPPASAFPAASALDDPNPLLPPALRLALVDLLEEAERIRAALAALAAQADEAQADETENIRSFLKQAAALLNLIADALSATGHARAALLAAVSKRTAGITISDTASWRWAGEALLGQLRAVQRIIAEVDDPRPDAHAKEAGAAPALLRGLGGLAPAASTLRANIGISSEAGRHALRLAVVAAFAEAMVQATGMYQGRWVTLTIFLVLKPDYASTVYRGTQRALGTIIGAGLGGALAAYFHLGQGGFVVGASIYIALGYALFDVSYLLFSLLLTAFIVDLLGVLGTPAVTTAEARLLDTP